MGGVDEVFAYIVPYRSPHLRPNKRILIMSFTNGEEAFKGVGAPSLKNEVSGEWHYRA